MDRSSQNPSTFKWKWARELGLGGHEVEEWENFSKALAHEGIFLTDSLEDLVWT